MKRFSTFLLLLFFLRSSKASIGYVDVNGCPVYTHISMKKFGNLCYQFVPYEKYWNEADSFCKKGRGRLVKVNNSKTNDFIIKSLNEMQDWTNNGVWIGLNDLQHEGTWMWSNKKNKDEEPLDQCFSYWGSKPIGSLLWDITDCVRMSRGWGDWKWYETACYTYNWKYRFICQYDAIDTHPIQAQNLQAGKKETAQTSFEGLDTHPNQTQIFYSSWYDVNLRPTLSLYHNNLITEGFNDSSKLLAIFLVLVIILLGFSLLVIYRQRKAGLHNQLYYGQSKPNKLSWSSNEKDLPENIENIKNQKRCENLYTLPNNLMPIKEERGLKGYADESEAIYEQIG